jgi:hypothetical protein
MAALHADMMRSNFNWKAHEGIRGVNEQQLGFNVCVALLDLLQDLVDVLQPFAVLVSSHGAASLLVHSLAFNDTAIHRIGGPVAISSARVRELTTGAPCELFTANATGVHSEWYIPNNVYSALVVVWAVQDKTGLPLRGGGWTHRLRAVSDTAPTQQIHLRRACV